VTGAPRFPNEAPHPARGGFADGYAPLARRFSALLAEGEETGGAIAVYVRGLPVARLWGGFADVASKRPWEADSRVVVFSVTKGLTAMALHLLAARGKFEWEAPVASVWPGFAASGKGAVTFRQLFNHRAGLCAIDVPLTLVDCIGAGADPTSRDRVRSALETQRPAWQPGTDQGYHAISFGLYAREVFRAIASESIGTFLKRELFDPLGSDARLGADATFDDRVATLYPPSLATRLAGMIAAIASGSSNEARVARSIVARDSLTRRAFQNPRNGPEGLLAYNGVAVRRAELPWGSATSSADGLARAYIPFANGGEHEGRSYFDAATLTPLFTRQSWSDQDRVLQKPLGWSQGFLKEEPDVFSPHRESFGHAGMGGSIGWCDPVAGVSLGYVTNRMDWRVRSTRAKALFRALYACEPLIRV
jgi:CubicO group peptidase (beta-lactamase class C family)